MLLYFGKTNQAKTYTINDTALGRVVEERDLRGKVHCSMKDETCECEGICHIYLHWSGTEYKNWNAMKLLRHI